MTKARVTLATCAHKPDLYKGEEGLIEALRERDCLVEVANWDDPTVNWDEAGMVVVRSVSNYPSQREQFLAWANSVPRLLNHPDILDWNLDKHYLIELEKRGLPIIPTTWLEPEQNLSKQQVHSRFPALQDFVIKPAVSSGLRELGRYSAIEPAARREGVNHAMKLLQAGRSVMLQRYQEQIDTYGEISLIFFNGLVSHSVEKRGMLSPHQVTGTNVRETVTTTREASAEEWQWGEQIRVVLHDYVRSRMGRDEQFLFNRVDLVPDGAGSFMLMEVSMVDADLYLGSSPEALGNFADAISVRAHW